MKTSRSCVDQRVSMTKRALKIAQDVRRLYDNGHPEYALHCMCAIVSAELSETLTNAKIKHLIHVANIGNQCHVFIVVRGMLLDLTARQFNIDHPPIVYRKLKKCESEWYWKTAGTHKTAVDLVTEQHRQGWPKEQIHRRLLNDVKKVALK